MLFCLARVEDLGGSRIRDFQGFGVASFQAEEAAAVGSQQRVARGSSYLSQLIRDASFLVFQPQKKLLMATALVLSHDQPAPSPISSPRVILQGAMVLNHAPFGFDYLLSLSLNLPPKA